MTGPAQHKREAKTEVFADWFGALTEEEKLDYLQLYAMSQINGKPLVAAFDEEHRHIILSTMDKRRYRFRLHLACPLTEKQGHVSFGGHMWITIEAEAGSVSFGIGYYPEETRLRGLVCGRGLLRDDRKCTALDCAILSASISAREILAIAELARNRFIGRKYCIGAYFGAVDCTVFAEEAARIARIEVPRRPRIFWRHCPPCRMKAIFHANRSRAAVECIINGSVWQNQWQTGWNLLRRACTQMCGAFRARGWSFANGGAATG